MGLYKCTRSQYHSPKSCTNSQIVAIQIDINIQDPPFIEHSATAA